MNNEQKKDVLFFYIRTRKAISAILVLVLIFANGPRSYDGIIFIDGYSDTHITFRWETSRGMDFVPDTLQMHPQYILTDMELSQSFTAYVAGTLKIRKSKILKNLKLKIILKLKSEIYPSNCRWLALVFVVLV